MDTNLTGDARADKKMPRCARHPRLTPEQLAELAARFPVGHREQTAFLLARHDDSAPLLAAVLATSARVVRRHARGALLPPGPRLRRVLDFVCPECLSDRAAEETYQAERGARRAARRALRDGSR
ncbi:hypothetical protein IPZ58_27665 [Streptomyces roseoverticillatus]|uniref:hypothetical protein n=1 Tax=Streptomyces roseoverticillatus TaxID=66429 RepID=UPI001F1F6D52|nr:hypothetical protein [Streptomyces roseoverticillatus]MCF3105343.1 hypothetical protein [Streptomyces roseoverticillatus]